MLTAIIIDLDGTLCDTTHRQHFVDGTDGKKCFEGFYGGIADDPPNKWCVEIVTSFYDKAFMILFTTGRPEAYRKQTEKWLKKHVDISRRSYRLLMRRNGDYRKDSVVKAELYSKEIKPSYNILLCIDDRQQVIDMWRSMGLVALQCARGDF